MELCLAGQKLLLGNWEKVDEGYPSNWIRRALTESENYLGLIVTYYGSYSPYSEHNDFYWGPMFVGSRLHVLSDIYFRLYPSPKPYIDPNTGVYYSCLSKPLMTFLPHQLSKAKAHMDDFLLRFKKLKAFI